MWSSVRQLGGAPVIVDSSRAASAPIADGRSSDQSRYVLTMPAAARHSFTTLDFAIFGIALIGSMLIGLFYALKGRQTNSTTKEFLLGGRKMPLLPTALSLLTSLVSGISLLSYPAEIYNFGTAFCWSTVGVTMALICTGVFIIPVIYPIQSVSIYHYLEDRFGSRILRTYGAILFTLSTLLYISIVLYAPSVALAGVTDVPVWALVTSVGLVCTFYSSIGGLKAVVWTDTFQAVIMYAGSITLAIVGTTAVGGVGRVFEIAGKHGRLDGFSNIDTNPFQHMTVWTALFGGWWYWWTSFGSNQMSLQRYCSVSSMRRAQWLTIITIPLMIVVNVLVFYTGLTMFAYYQGCDPQKRGLVKSDQLVIYFMVEVLQPIKGMPGLFLACLFSGTLSTVSSGVNSLSAVGWAEFVKPFIKNADERKATYITKGIGLLYGLGAIGLAFAAEPLGGILQALTSGLGAFSGPLLGLILLGVLTPFGNFVGGLVGTTVGTALTLWIFIGSNTKRYPTTALPSTIDQCPNIFNQTTTLASTTLSFSPTAEALVDTTHAAVDALKTLYSLSFFMYALVGAVTTLIVGVIVSLLWIAVRRRYEPADPEFVLWTVGKKSKLAQAGMEKAKSPPESYNVISADGPSVSLRPAYEHDAEERL